MGDDEKTINFLKPKVKQFKSEKEWDITFFVTPE